MTAYDLFLSYARADNEPPPGGGPGFITAFHDRLKASHARFTSGGLSAFFDSDSIREGEDWEARIYEGLRSSKLFIAFLSPAYLKSAWCRREWVEYLRLEHRIARGNDGLLPIFLVHVPELHGPGANADEDAVAHDPARDAWIADLKRRQHGESFDLIDWYGRGAGLLADIASPDRLAARRARPEDDTDGLVLLSDRIDAIDARIAARLDRVLLAELATDIGNSHIEERHPHFIGRHRELIELHEALTATERIGILSALHGLGGQGKTALAVQYAYAYAEHYAAGGCWKLGCEGKASLAEVLEQLVTLAGIPPAPREADTAEAVRHVLRALKARSEAQVPRIKEQLSQSPALRAPGGALPEVEPHVLLILDNVDRPELLSAAETARLVAEDWLKVIVTTREAPASFGIDDTRLKAISVDDLPEADALALIRDYRPFTSPNEEAAAREIVRRLGGFTLAVELVAAYLSKAPTVSIAGYLRRLEKEGLSSVDTHGKDAKTADVILHRQKQVGLIVDDAIAELSDHALEALAFASLLPPDHIVLPWLQALAATSYPELEAEAEPGYEHPWHSALADLVGRRLLLPADARQGKAAEPWHFRMHRLVSEHVRRRIPVEARLRADEWIIEATDEFAAVFEDQWRHDPSWLRFLAPLRETALLALERAPQRRELAMAAGVAATAELETGSLRRGEQLLLASHETLASAAASWPDDAEAQRLVSVSLNELGDFYVSRGQPGDADRALQAFEESLEIAQRLFEANPTSAAAARDVSVSLDRLGDFYIRRGESGDADRALQAFEESHRTLQRLFEANPTSAAAARDVSVSLNKLGDFYVSRGQPGDADRALQAFEESHRTLQRLFEANPTSAAAARDVSASRERLGDFYVRRGESGDADRALRAFEESLEIAQRLFEANPTSAAAARDVSVSLNKLGDFYVSRGQPGDADRALQAFEESLEIDQRLFEANPTSAAAARDLAASHQRLAMIADRTGDVAGARHHLTACFAILDDFHRAGRPWDPQMRQLHAQLAPRFTRAPSIDPADIPADLVQGFFSAPQARELILKVMADNGLEGDPATLPDETKRAMISMLIAQGVIGIAPPTTDDGTIDAENPSGEDSTP